MAQVLKVDLAHFDKNGPMQHSGSKGLRLGLRLRGALLEVVQHDVELLDGGAVVPQGYTSANR